jgi:sulfur carrier protein
LKPYSLATGCGRVGYGFFIDMIVQINGEKREVGTSLSVAELLEELSIRPGRVVIELNRDVLPRDAYQNTLLKEGDAVEIVHFVGGG